MAKSKSSGVNVQAGRIVIGDLNALLDEPKARSTPALRTAAAKAVSRARSSKVLYVTGGERTDRTTSDADF